MVDLKILKKGDTVYADVYGSKDACECIVANVWESTLSVKAKNSDAKRVLDAKKVFYKKEDYTPYP